MIKHHPDSRIMNEYVAGTLPWAQSACVSIHLNYCDHCKRQVDSLQQMGGDMLEHLEPAKIDQDLMAAVFARLDEEPPLSFERKPAGEDEWPVLVQRLMAGDYSELDWKRVTRSLRVSHLKTGDPEHEFAFYHIAAGGRIPEHTHRGSELTLVLEGSFSDEEDVYQRGDFIYRDAEHVHTPMAARSEDCICIGVLDAPISFTGWRHKMLNPFLQMQAQ
jgi:putative transcriptional regulator